MLIMTRTKDQTVHIGPNVVVRVMGIKNNQVKLGFEADYSIAIHPGERMDKVQDAVRSVLRKSVLGQLLPPK